MNQARSLEQKNQFKLTGNVSLYELPADYTYEDFKRLSDKEKYLVDRGDNLAVTIGLQQVILLMIGSNTNSFTHCGVGSGTNTPAAGDLDLQTAIGRNTVNDRYRVGLSGYWNTFFGKSDQNGTWNETCLATASSGNNILCRRKFDAAFTKDTSKSSVISWVITLAAVAD